MCLYKCKNISYTLLVMNIILCFYQVIAIFIEMLSKHVSNFLIKAWIMNNKLYSIHVVTKLWSHKCLYVTNGEHNLTTYLLFFISHLKPQCKHHFIPLIFCLVLFMLFKPIVQLCSLLWHKTIKEQGRYVCVLLYLFVICRHFLVKIKRANQKMLVLFFWLGLRFAWCGTLMFVSYTYIYMFMTKALKYMNLHTIYFFTYVQYVWRLRKLINHIIIIIIIIITRADIGNIIFLVGNH